MAFHLLGHTIRSSLREHPSLCLTGVTSRSWEFLSSSQSLCQYLHPVTGIPVASFILWDTTSQQRSSQVTRGLPGWWLTYFCSPGVVLRCQVPTKATLSSAAGWGRENIMTDPWVEVRIGEIIHQIPSWAKQVLSNAYQLRDMHWIFY